MENRDKELGMITSMEKELLELKKIISQEDKSKQIEELFIELMNQGLTVKFDKVNQTVTYRDFIGDPIIYIDFKDDHIFFTKEKFWDVFKTLDINTPQITPILSGLVDKHLGLTGYTASYFVNYVGSLNGSCILFYRVSGIKPYRLHFFTGCVRGENSRLKYIKPL